MKITITDNDKTITLENATRMSDQKVRKLLDVMFTAEEGEDPTLTVASVELPTPRIPLDYEEYGAWLRSGIASVRIKELSLYADYDVGKLTTVNSMMRKAPQFAARLGYYRFKLTCTWLFAQGKLKYLPQESSFRTYFRKALKNAGVMY